MLHQRELPGKEKSDARLSTGETARVTASLPQGFALSERCAAVLRAALEGEGLHHYRVVFSDDLDFQDIDDHLATLGEREGAWDELGACVAGGEPVEAVVVEGK